MTSQQDTMFQEAIKAARDGDKVRARDLLTRLLRVTKNNPEYWLWMSGVVETRQELLFCLQNLRQLDPENEIARKGLIMIGETPAENVVPVPPNRPKKWESDKLDQEVPTGFRAVLANPFLKALVYSAVGIFVVGMITIAIYGALALRSARPSEPTPDLQATASQIIFVTLTPSLTITPTPTARFPTSTPTPGTPTPLVFYLEATYTATPLYVNTPHNEAEAYRSGINAFRRGDWEAAIGFWEQVVVVSPEDADLQFHIGQAQMNLGDYESALASFNKAIDLNDSFAPGYWGRARVFLSQGSDTEAIADLDKTIELDEFFGEAYLDRAAYWLRQGDPEKAWQDLIIVETLLPESSLLNFYRGQAEYQLGNLNSALEHATLAQEADFTSLPVYLFLGQVYFELGDIIQATQPLETYLLYNPNNLLGLNLLSEIYLKTGREEDAILLLERTISIDDTWELRYARGLLYLKIEDAQAALDDLMIANNLHRNDFDITIAIGRAFMGLENYNAAYVRFDGAENLARNDEQLASVFYYRALTLEAFADLSSLIAAERDWNDLLELPEEAVPVEWGQTAIEHLLILNPPTPTPSFTPTITPTITRTPTP
jgi:tetratricopeptide (TPR) repeat protein